MYRLGGTKFLSSVSHRKRRETKRGWKVFFGLLIWLAVMWTIWTFWPD
jgi:hypothetical protein